jgi:hypothetical protein
MHRAGSADAYKLPKIPSKFRVPWNARRIRGSGGWPAGRLAGWPVNGPTRGEPGGYAALPLLVDLAAASPELRHVSSATWATRFGWPRTRCLSAAVGDESSSRPGVPKTPRVRRVILFAGTYLHLPHFRIIVRRMGTTGNADRILRLRSERGTFFRRELDGGSVPATGKWRCARIRVSIFGLRDASHDGSQCEASERQTAHVAIERCARLLMRPASLSSSVDRAQLGARRAGAAC